MSGYHMTDSYCISYLLISLSVNLVTASLKDNNIHLYYHTIKSLNTRRH